MEGGTHTWAWSKMGLGVEDKARALVSQEFLP